MSKPAPKSQMLRVPTASTDSKTDIEFIPTNTNTKHLEEKLDQLETQLKSDSERECVCFALSADLSVRQTLLQKLEKIETAIRTTRSSQNSYRRSNSYNPFQQPTVELGPFPHDNLAQRLGLNSATLLAEREKLTTKEFISYTRHRDPRSFGWEYREDGLYHPIQQ